MREYGWDLLSICQIHNYAGIKFTDEPINIIKCLESIFDTTKKHAMKTIGRVKLLNTKITKSMEAEEPLITGKNFNSENPWIIKVNL